MAATRCAATVAAVLGRAFVPRAYANKEMGMRAAVFSDVEGTLIDGSLPQIFLELGEHLGMYSPWQRARIRVLQRAARPWGRACAAKPLC